MPAQSSRVLARSPHGEGAELEVAHEISRVVRVSSIPEELPPSQGARILERLDTCAAFALVVLASSGVLCAAVWMLQHWQLR